MMLTRSRAVLWLATLLTCVYTAQSGDMHMEKSEAMDMLKKYNYMNSDHQPDMAEDDMFKQALEIFQQVANISMTGELNEETMEKMNARRCGEPDVMGHGDMMRRRRRRYAIAGTKWTGEVGYNYVNYPTKPGSISAAETEKVMDRAFQTWSGVGNLAFRKKTSRADIEISFVTGQHGDGNALDGPGKSLAHAFFPSTHVLGGDMHVDDEEVWSVNGGEGTDLYYVALHELGHSLGLSHSTDMEAVMYPYYPGYIKDLKLRPDDINGIRAIYGSRSLPPGPGPETTTVHPSPPNSAAEQFCERGTVDAAGTLGDKLYIFQGSLYAELDDHGILAGYPRDISEDWLDLPSDLDAALSLSQYNMILFFKNNLYWRYEMDEEGNPLLVQGYPRYIFQDFTGGLPDEVHAAFTWSKNGRMFLVNGGDYYRIQSEIGVRPDRLEVRCAKWYFEYPRSFDSRWRIDSDTLSDATLFHGRTFFFNGRNYYRYHDTKLRADEGYPMVTSKHWFGCTPPGALEIPDMEMDMMGDVNQFEEISVGLHDIISRASQGTPSSIVVIVMLLNLTIYNLM